MFKNSALFYFLSFLTPAVCLLFLAALPVRLISAESADEIELVDYTDPASRQTVKAVKNAVMIKFKKRDKKELLGQKKGKDLIDFFLENEFHLRRPKPGMTNTLVRPPENGKPAAADTPFTQVIETIVRGRAIAFNIEITNMEQTIKNFAAKEFIQYAEPIFIRYSFENQ